MASETVYNIFDAALLKAQPRRTALRVFLCGPSTLHPLYEARTHIRECLQKAENVKVTFGEELIGRKSPFRADLQTVESVEAAKSDFTVLLVDSPGAIAELGSFSTSEFLRTRLFAIIPAEYYESRSYIARGPLSVLARNFQSSVTYFERSNLSALTRATMMPVAMFKFIGAKYPRRDRPYLDQKRFEADRGLYASTFQEDRNEFVRAYTLAAIHILSEPTFIDLVSFLAISPSELKATLSDLFKAESVSKRAGKYSARLGYSDKILSRLNSTAISLRRAAVTALRQ